MAQPGDVTHRLIRVTDAAGAGVAGLVLANFTITARSRAYGAGAWSAFTPGSVLTDLGGGLYGLQFTLPTSAGWWRLIIDHASHTVWPGSWEGELEANDLDVVAAYAVRPQVTISGAGTIGQTVAVQLINKRYRRLRFTFNDQNGAPIDMTAGTTYNGYAWSVRAANSQTAAPKYDQTTGITAGLGFVEVTILEAATLFNALTEGATPALTLDCRHELTADLVAVAGETVSLVAPSPLTLLRREVGT